MRQITQNINGMPINKHTNKHTNIQTHQHPNESHAFFPFAICFADMLPKNMQTIFYADLPLLNNTRNSLVKITVQGKTKANRHKKNTKTNESIQTNQ